MVIKPYGYAIWEKMQAELIECLKKQVIKTLISPFYLKACLKQKRKMRKDLQECAIVTHYRLKNDPDKPGKLMVDPNAKLEEELIVRPTSEAIIWSTYKGWYNPIGFTLLINQWANGSMGDENTIVLRTAEFYGKKVIPHMLPKTEAIEVGENDECIC
jgi:prolyl-tRNA synthetase